MLPRSLARGLESIQAEYRVLRSSRMRNAMPGLPVTGADAAWEFRNEADYYRQLAMARWTDQNDPLVGQAVDRLVNLVFKTGMKFDAATGNPEADEIIKRAWCKWAHNPSNCDARGRNTLAGLAKLVFRATVVDGDHVVLPLRNRRLQCVEGHRMQTPRNRQGDGSRLHCGVLTDADGRPVEYWLTKQEHAPLWQSSVDSEVTRYPAYYPSGYPAALHIFNPKRASQNRGITTFIHLMENAMTHADLQFAMLIKEQAAACVTILREREASTAAMPLGGAATFGAEETVVNRDGSTTTVHEMRPGLEIEGRPGEKLSINAPNLPGDGFLKHSVQVLTFIAVNLGIPVQVLLLDPTQSNFSSWRGSMDVAQHGFASIREWMITQFYTPVYEWWLRGEIATNAEIAALYDELKEDIFGHQWTPPYDPYIEPSKDIAAETNQVSARLDSRRNVLARRGLDLDDVDRDIVLDQVALLKMCAHGAHELNEAFPEAGFTWRDVYQVGMVQGSPPATPVDSGQLTVDSEEESTTKTGGASGNKKGDEDA